MLAARVDGNQAQIVEALRAVGCSVVDLHRVGGGVSDLLACFRGETFLIECKVGEPRFTEAEDAFMASWPGRIEVVTSPEGALRAIGATP